MELKFHKIFSKELEFVKLELYGKLKFKKNDKSLIVSQILVDSYIFCQTIILAHFGLKGMGRWVHGNINGV